MQQDVPRTLSVPQARDFILSHCPVVSDTETVALLEACGRVAAHRICSPLTLPPFDNSAMDGYAFAWSDVASLETVVLPVVGESLAGHPYAPGTAPKGSSVRITTGARMPETCDTVIPFEKTTFTNTEVRFRPADVKPGANVRHAGEEMAVGDAVIEAGTILTAAHIALIASLGMASVEVFRPLTVALLVTGDELAEPGETLPEGGIYNANGPALLTLLQRLGCRTQYEGILADNPKIIGAALERARTGADMILMSGGAADSSADYSHQQLAARGKIFDWTINMRPGRPMRFGHLDKTPVFILPGNPVASISVFLEFVRGALLFMQGVAGDVWPQSVRAELTRDLKSKPGRAEFVRAQLDRDAGAPVRVTPNKNQSSASLRSLADSQALIALDHDDAVVTDGSIVDVHLLGELL
ncbi:MAG: gephyrin-like molybdotransferase Glp [Duodenibacillus sp.]